MQRADVLSIAGLLKRYLYCTRTNPLISSEYRNRMLKVCHSKSKLRTEAKVFQMQVIFNSMPNLERSICKVVFQHLSRLGQRTGDTKLSIKQLSFIWAPVFFHVTASECSITGDSEDALAQM